MQGACTSSTKRRSRTKSIKKSPHGDSNGTPPASTMTPLRGNTSTTTLGGNRAVTPLGGNPNDIQVSGVGSDSATHEITHTNQVTSRRGRGPSKGVEKPDSDKERLLVHVSHNTLMLAKARNHIQPLLRTFFGKFRKTWAAWEEIEKDGLWEAFLVYYRFESPEMEVLGRKAWDAFISQNYPKFLFQWKRAALKKHGSIVAAKEHCPSWTKRDVWNDLCNHWLSEEFKKASSLRKANRDGGVVIPHASGSTPHVIRRIIKEKELGRPLTQYEDFMEMHTIKNKETNEKQVNCKEAEHILDDYEKRLREKHGDYDMPVNELEDEGLEIYKDVVGGVKKGHLLGRPKEKWSARKTARCPPEFEAQDALREVKKLRHDNEQRDKELKEKDKIIASLLNTVNLLCEKAGVPPPIVSDASCTLVSSDEESEDDCDSMDVGL